MTPVPARAPLRRLFALLLAGALLSACGADGEPEPPPGGTKVSISGRFSVGVAGGG